MKSVGWQRPKRVGLWLFLSLVNIYTIPAAANRPPVQILASCPSLVELATMAVTKEQSTEAYVRLLEHTVNQNLLSAEALQTLRDLPVKYQPMDFAEGDRTKIQGYAGVFESLLEKEIDWDAVRAKIDALLEKQGVRQEKRQRAREETRGIFFPVIQNVNPEMKDAFHSRPLVAKFDGKWYGIVGAKNSLNFFDPVTNKQTGSIQTGKRILQTPTLYEAKNHLYAIITEQDGATYIVDVPAQEIARKVEAEKVYSEATLLETPKGPLGIIAGWDGTITVFDAVTGKRRRTIEGPSSMAGGAPRIFKEGGKNLCLAVGNSQFVVFNPLTGKDVWYGDVKTQNTFHEFRNAPGMIEFNGRHYALTGTKSSGREIYLFDPLKDENVEPLADVGQTGEVVPLMYKGRPYFIMTVYLGDPLQLVDPVAGKVIRALKRDEQGHHIETFGGKPLIYWHKERPYVLFGDKDGGFYVVDIFDDMRIVERAETGEGNGFWDGPSLMHTETGDFVFIGGDKGLTKIQIFGLPTK